MQQQFIRFQLHLIQKPPLIRADIIRAYGNVELLPKGFGKITDTVRGNHNRQTLRLLKDQDILSNLRQLHILRQIHQFLGKSAQHGRLKKRAADRLGQIAAEALLPVQKLVVASRIRSKGNHRRILAQTARLCPQPVKTLNPIHPRHQMIH